MTTEEAGFLHDAVRDNDRTKVSQLLKKGADVNAVYYGMTPFLVAITKGHSDLALMLVEAGCDVCQPDVQGTMTPFQEAVINNLVKVVEAIAKKGKVDVNQPIKRTGHTGLTYAAEKKLPKLAQALITGGADYNLSNPRGFTPLYIAAQEGSAEVLQVLLKAGVDRNQRLGPHQQTPLVVAMLNDHENVALHLIKSGCDLNLPDEDGMTALWYAVSDANEDLTRALVSAGADVNVTDPEGRTMLQEATENDMEDIVHILKRGK